MDGHFYYAVTAKCQMTIDLEKRLMKEAAVEIENQKRLGVCEKEQKPFCKRD